MSLAPLSPLSPGGPPAASPGGPPAAAPEPPAALLPASVAALPAMAAPPGAPPAERRKLRVLVLSSDTGGGHRASAQALRAALEALYPAQVHVDIVDFWVDLAAGPFAGFPGQYTFLAKRPVLWKMSYELTRFPPARGVTEAMFNAFGHRRVRDAFVKYAPDLIVSVHPLVNTLSQKVLKEMRLTTGMPTMPYVTVVTDLGGAHPTWFHKSVDMTYIPSDGVLKVARKVGIQPGKIRQLGLPVREAFWHPPPDKEALRAQLGMRPNTRAVLAIGGGDGVGGLKSVAETLALSLAEDVGPDNVQVVVVCGKNESLRDYLLSKTWPLNLIALGYVNNMSDWMAACDIICTKAGPGTIAEALIRGLPTIITGFLPGQEEANVNFVVREGVGEFAKKPKKIAALAAKWLGNPHLLDEMSHRARACGRPQASLEIASDLIEVAKEKITENMHILERQRALRDASGLDMVGPHSVQLVDSSPESHLIFRVRFLLRVVIGSMIANQAINRDRNSRSPPSSPVDSRASAERSDV